MCIVIWAIWLCGIGPLRPTTGLDVRRCLLSFQASSTTIATARLSAKLSSGCEEGLVSGYWQGGVQVAQSRPQRLVPAAASLGGDSQQGVPQGNAELLQYDDAENPWQVILGADAH